ncbi:VCBS repeat-containing protein [Thermobifida halotolerans]|uniref:VCBS repeat-containing protein n=2 Tax=Thermobifida halotolerans TaxID=483545 RepID=A0A399G2X5_9ACTN|nr:VCBS repeat-containing protein [Thermobifida halotolerans]UOE19978.1 VCBS repeat-containing protein [Thermobifida halotolerans]
MDMVVSIPAFRLEVVEEGLTDGYWITAADIDGDGRPDLVTSGVAEGRISWYRNPDWTKQEIARLHRPVAVDVGDVTGDGRPDLIVCHDYGRTLRECKPDQGMISWLGNPGADGGSGPWQRHDIGQLCSAHRIIGVRLGGEERLSVLAAPMVGPSGGEEALTQPVRLTAYRQPEDPRTTPWNAEVIDDSTYSLVHELTPARRVGPSTSTPLLVASAEGVTELAYEETAGHWKATAIGSGERTQKPRTGFQGSNSASLGRLAGGGNYVAALEPFHGNTVAVYTPDPNEAGTRWRRTVLDVFADPNEAGEGPGHDLVCADLDGDGEDEFLVALRGPQPWQGVFYYKAVDASRGLWTKKRVSTESAARIAVADFDGDGRLDFATVGYSVPGYFQADNPKVVVAYNTGFGS